MLPDLQPIVAVPPPRILATWWYLAMRTATWEITRSLTTGDASWSGGPVMVRVYHRWSDRPDTWQAGERFTCLSPYLEAARAGQPWSMVGWREPSGRVERFDAERWDFVRRPTWDHTYGRKFIPVPRMKPVAGRMVQSSRMI